MSCLLWGFVAVESKGWLHDLHRAPAEGGVALLTWHLNTVFVAMTLKPTRSLDGLTHSTDLNKHNTVIFLNKGTAGENVQEHSRRRTYQVRT